MEDRLVESLPLSLFASHPCRTLSHAQHCRKQENPPTSSSHSLSISLILPNSCALCKSPPTISFSPPPHLLLPPFLICSPCSVMQSRSNAYCATWGFKAPDCLSQGARKRWVHWTDLILHLFDKMCIVGVEASLQPWITGKFPVNMHIIQYPLCKQRRWETHTRGSCSPPVPHQLHGNVNAVATASRGPLRCSHTGPYSKHIASHQMHTHAHMHAQAHTHSTHNLQQRCSEQTQRPRCTRKHNLKKRKTSQTLYNEHNEIIVESMS